MRPPCASRGGQRRDELTRRQRGPPHRRRQRHVERAGTEARQQLCAGAVRMEGRGRGRDHGNYRANNAPTPTRRRRRWDGLHGRGGHHEKAMGSGASAPSSKQYAAPVGSCTTHSRGGASIQWVGEKCFGMPRSQPTSEPEGGGVTTGHQPGAVRRHVTQRGRRGPT